MRPYFSTLMLYFSRRSAVHLLLVMLLLHVLIWTVAQALATTNLDRYGDMLENYAWGQVLQWGSFKHPPLFAWVAGLWFRVFPTTDLAYQFMAYLNVALGLAGVYRLALAMRLSVIALPAVILLCLAFPYSTLAAKFNANSVLLSVWPWVALAWWHSVHGQSRQSLYMWSAGFGVLGALAMLGKYYSGVFLLSLFLISFSFADGRRWLFSVRAWLTLIVFMICLLPHFFWLQQHDFISLRYVGEQGGDGQVVWRHILRFALAPILYWGVPWLICALIYAPHGQRWRGLSHRLITSWACRGWGDVLFWLAMLPWMISLIFGLTGKVELSLPWAIPVGFAFPLLWLRNLCVDRSGVLAAEPVSSQSNTLLRVFLMILLAVPPLALVQGWRDAKNGTDNYYLPRREAAQALLTEWHTRFPAAKLAWVGGAWGENALLAFYGDASVRVLPGVPDEFPATLSPLSDWQSKPGLLLCPPAAEPANAQALCDNQMQVWLRSKNQQTSPLIITIARQGWRFPQNRPYEYHAYAVMPATIDGR